MNRERNFTLTELLVVIGIIGLLASMLLPVLGKARNSAYNVQCTNNLRQIGLGFEMYRGDYNQFHMPLRIASMDRTQQDDIWAGALARDYDVSDGVMECPAGVHDGTDLWGWNEVDCRFWVPDWQNMKEPRFGLGAPALCGYSVSSLTCADVDSLGYTAYKFNPASLTLSSSEIMQAMDGTAYFYLPDADDDHRMSLVSNFRAQDRHDGKVNFLYFDNHVAPVKYSATLDPEKNANATDWYRIDKGTRKKRPGQLK